MPKLSVWMVRCSLIYMGIGYLFGSLLLFHKGVPIDSWAWRLLNPHMELMTFGWVMQFIMGTAFWILPRFPNRERRYGNVRLGWSGFILLNTGVLLTTLSGWLAQSHLALLGRLILLVSTLIFVRLTWARVKPFGKHATS